MWKKLNIRFEFGKVEIKTKKEPKKIEQPKKQIKSVPLPHHEKIVNFLSQQLK
jgi:hypothetical protein